LSQERYPVLWIGQAAVVSLPVEIDMTNAETISEELLSVVNSGAALLVADMSKTTFCDSSGVRALSHTYRQAAASQGEMRLVVGAPTVQRVLTITGVDRLINIFPSLAAALASEPAPDK
jgi:anti-sigma B factor antagonist